MENEKVKVTELEVGEYECGNFYIKKVHVDIKDIKVPEHIKGVAEKEGYVPCIIVGDKGMLWTSMVKFGASMYMYLDSLEVKDGKVVGESALATNVILNQMFFASTAMADIEYYKNNDKEINAFMERVVK